jgi:hypothetical protein
VVADAAPYRGRVRPATTIVLGILLLLIFGAAMIQFLVLAR